MNNDYILIRSNHPDVEIDKFHLHKFNDKSSELDRHITRLAHELIEKLQSNIDIKTVKQINLQVRAHEIHIAVEFLDKEMNFEWTSLQVPAQQVAKTVIDVIKEFKIFHERDQELAFIKQTQHLFAQAQNLSNVFPIKIQHQDPQTRFLLERIHHFFHRFISYFLTVNPILQTGIEELLKRTKTNEDIKQLYIDHQSWFRELKDKILAKDPLLTQTFTDQELDHMIDEQFIQQVNQFLNKTKQSKWNKEGLYQLNVLRLIHTAAVSPDFEEALKELDRVDPLKMPLEALAKIPVTRESSEAVVTIWKNLLGNLFYKGQLDQMKTKTDTRDIIIQTAFASQYLDALHFMPEEVRVDLKTFCKELNHLQEAYSIQDLLIQHATVFNTSFKSADPAIQHEQDIYNSKIYPHLMTFMKEELEDSGEATTLIKFLSLDKTSTENIQELIQSISKEMTPDEIKTFDQEKIKGLIYNEMERVAVLDYHLLSLQLDLLREVRKTVKATERAQDLLVHTRSDISEFYGKKRTEIEQEFHLLLEKEEQALVDQYPLMQIPTLHVPISLDKTEQRAKIIPVYLKHMDRLEFEILEEIESRQQEIENLNERGNVGKEEQVNVEKEEQINAKVLENKEKIKKLEQQLEKFSQIQEANALENKEKLNQLLSTMTDFAIGTSKLPISHIKKSTYGYALDKTKKKLKKDLKILEKNISTLAQNNVTVEQKEAVKALKEEIENLKKIKNQVHAFKNQRGEIRSALEEKQKLAVIQLEKEKINAFAKLENQFKFLLERESFPPINDLIFNDEILKTVSVSEKSSVFSSNQLSNLLFITRLLNQLNLESPKPLTNEEKTTFKLLLKQVENDADFKSKLKLFLKDDNRAEVEGLLAYVPGFLHGLAKRFIKTDVLAESFNLKIPSGATKDSLEFLDDYLDNLSFYRHDKERLKGINKQVEQLVSKYNVDPDSVLPRERLSLKQMGVLTRFSRLNYFAVQLKKLDLLEAGSDLQEFASLITQSKRSLAEIETVIRPSIDRHYTDGSLLAYVGKKKSEWMGKPISFEEQITMFAADGFTHGAKLYREKSDNHIQISHIYSDWEQDMLSLYQICISDIWELDIVPLVPPSMQSILEDVYGDDWKNKLNQRYQAIERGLHAKGKEQFEYVGNNKKRRFAAGFANYSSLFQMMGRKDVLSHQRPYPRDLDKLHDKFFGGEPPDEIQICSEFASKATLVSMLQLNRELTKKIQTKMGNAYSGKSILNQFEDNFIEVPDSVKEYLTGKRYYEQEAHKTRSAEKQLIDLLRRLDYTPSTINLILRLGNKEIFDLPYKKTERLKAIHPGRMVQILTDKKCAKLKPPPEAILKLIDIS